MDFTNSAVGFCKPARKKNAESLFAGVAALLAACLAAQEHKDSWTKRFGFSVQPTHTEVIDPG